MKNKIKSLAIHLMLGASLIMGAVQAAEEDQERETAGERAVSKKEYLAVQEERAQRIEEQKGEEKPAQEEGKEEARTAKAVAKSIDGSNFYSTHPGAYHNPYSISILGDTVELEDGSVWLVKSGDRYKTFDWLTTDQLVITPNHDFFSSYPYRIRNLNTGKSVQVDLYLKPFYNGVYTHWIAAIDYYNGQICLEDGSVWDVSGFDQSIMNTWLLNDTLIIGTDDTLLGRTNILINANTLNYVSADCIY